MKAYVQGIRDELAPRVNALASYYSTVQEWPYDVTWRLTYAQYQRLFDRTPACWEPIALMLISLGGVEAGFPFDPTRTTLGQFGSNSWGVSDHGSMDGRVYVQSDPHGGSDAFHVLRFMARNGTLEGGGLTMIRFPFVLGGFAKWVAWGTNYNAPDMYDYMEYLADLTGGTEVYQSEADASCSFTSLTAQNIGVDVWNWQTMQEEPRSFRELYLHSSSTLPGRDEIWVGGRVPYVTGTCERVNHKIYVTRFGSLERGILNKDTPWDFPRMLYRMHLAPSAEAIVGQALGGAQSLYPLGLIIGSDFEVMTPTGPIPGGPQPQGPSGGEFSLPQLIYLACSRVPYRPNDINFTSNWAGVAPMSGTGTTLKWTTGGPDGTMYYPIDAFPTIRSFVPAGSQYPKFFGSCNSSIQYIFGKEHPFPEVHPNESTDQNAEPSYGTRLGQTGPVYQVPPWFTDFSTYFNWASGTPSTITGSYAYFWSPIELNWTVGGLTIRQEWMIRKLKNAYEESQPYGVSESELRSLIVDRQEPVAYYLRHIAQFGSGLDWFTNLQLAYGTGTPKYALLGEFKNWGQQCGHNRRHSHARALAHLLVLFLREDTESPLARRRTNPRGRPVLPRSFLSVLPFCVQPQLARCGCCGSRSGARQHARVGRSGHVPPRTQASGSPVHPCSVHQFRLSGRDRAPIAQDHVQRHLPSRLLRSSYCHSAALGYRRRTGSDAHANSKHRGKWPRRSSQSLDHELRNRGGRPERKSLPRMGRPRRSRAVSRFHPALGAGHADRLPDDGGAVVHLRGLRARVQFHACLPPVGSP